MHAVMYTLRTWLALPWNIFRLRRQKAQLDEMRKANPGQTVYWLPPPA